MTRISVAVLAIMASIALTNQSMFRPMSSAGLTKMATMLPTTSIEPYPTFCESKKSIEEAFARLRYIINYQPQGAFQRHLTAFRFALYKTGEEVAKGVNFDCAYDAMKDLFALGMRAPEMAKDYNLKFIATIDNEVYPIRQWINQIIPDCGQTIDKAEIASCDQQVNILIQRNPSVQRQAKLFLETGKLTQMFSEVRSDLDHVALTELEGHYMAYHKDDVKPIIYQLATVFQLF